MAELNWKSKVPIRSWYGECFNRSTNYSLVYKKAIFHCWSQESQIVSPSILKGGHNGGTVSGVLAIVEYENGQVDKVQPERIRFADGGDFEQYCFIPVEELDKDKEGDGK